ncbi:MAG: DNA polymerase III subunit alpha [Candidatus Hatepunaea meridiana]|nr:DNA polymerase III subunit alpha [Candidatus Hatepunaea meridiana]
MSFIHLHNHSDYSILDGMCHLKGLVQTAVDQKAPAIALTDHGNLHGALEFYSLARKAKIKPIIGCEFYIAPKSRFDKKVSQGDTRYYHLVLLAKDYTGYRNLTKLSSEGYISGFYYKPRIDKELLSEYHQGLICLSGCLEGEIPQILLSGNMNAAKEVAGFYKSLFGEDFYLEIMRHGINEQEQIIPPMVELSHEMDIKLVATNDAHYIKREYAKVQDVLLCIGTQKQREDTNRKQFHGEEFYLKTPDEMVELFSDYPEAIASTLEIAEKCNLEIPLGENHFPIFDLPDPYLNADEYLTKLAYEGLKKRFPDGLPEGAEERLKYELEVIKQTGFANYFLIVADFIQWAKDHGIPVGAGRGSAAGCLVIYSLGITNLDPLKYELIFERFLNPERVSPPDIDIDFSDDRREEVIDYVKDKYGQDSVCRIITFGTMAARSAIRDVARVLGLAYAESDKIAKLIPLIGKEITIEKSIKDVPELRNLIASDPRFGELIEHALVIEGTIRHASTHAAGVVICPGPTVNYIPVCKQSDDDEMYSQYDMNWIDKLGLLKMDFLGLQTLQEIDLAQKALKKRGIDIDFNGRGEKYNDPGVFKLFGEGDTVGVFQFESGGMRKYLMKLKPETLEDLVAMNALYRPGPMKEIPVYIDCKFGKRKPKYLHPKLEPILKSTYGVITYQEQVMRIATDLANFSLGKADILRKAMGKKIPELMKSLGDEFIDRCEKNGIERKTAEAIYDLMAQFASYGFVKAHAAGYAIIAYQCGYLKHYYTPEYLAGCLTVRCNNTEQVMKLIAECRSHNITVMPPDINKSEARFVAIEKNILFGLAAIKNVGDTAVKAIIEARSEVGSFNSLHNFLASVDLRVVNKRVVESLIDAGAFDDLGPNRATMLASVSSAVAYAHAFAEEKLRNQTTLFGGGGDDDEGGIFLPPPDLHDMDELPDSELQLREKKVLGYYVSSHPLASYAREIDGLATYLLGDKDEFTHDTSYKVCVVISSAQHRNTRKGDMMAILKVEDLTGSIEALVFPKAYASIGDRLITDSLVGLSGRISRKDEEEEPKLIVDEIVNLDQAAEIWGQALHINLSAEYVTPPLLDRLESLFSDNRGSCMVYIDLTYPDGDKKTLLLDRYKVRPTQQVMQRLTEIVGEDQIRIM